MTRDVGSDRDVGHGGSAEQSGGVISRVLEHSNPIQVQSLGGSVYVQYDTCSVYVPKLPGPKWLEMSDLYIRSIVVLYGQSSLARL